MVELSPDEVQVLIEALDAWIIKDVGGSMIEDLMTAVLVREDDPRFEKMQRKRDTRRHLMEMEQQERAESATLIKAKLISYKRELAKR